MSFSDDAIHSVPEEQWQVSRRSFMQRLAGGVAAAGLLSGAGIASASTYRELRTAA